MKKTALWGMVALLAVGTAGNVLAQSPNDGFDPNADGDVWSIAVQADGKILVGGDFTTIGGHARNRIARLNPDGSLDTAFDPIANASVYTIVPQTDGRYSWAVYLPP